MDIKVAIIEDQKETRKMLSMLVNDSDGFECVASFENGESALAQIPRLAPDVVLVDIHLPGGMSGIETVRRLRAASAGAQCIMCTSLEDADSIFSALQAGACGYITKATPPAKILDAIQDVFNGGSPMSSQIARKVATYFHTMGAHKGKEELLKLSSREQEILNYLAKGYRYKEIAGLLYISLETVRKHIHNIYEKLQVNSRTDALNKVFPK